MVFRIKSIEAMKNTPRMFYQIDEHNRINIGYNVGVCTGYQSISLGNVIVGDIVYNDSDDTYKAISSNSGRVYLMNDSIEEVINVR